MQLATAPAPSDPSTFTLALFQLARTTGCEHFQQQLLQQLLKRFDADRGAITMWHPSTSFVAAAGSGYDLAAMTADWHAVGGGQLDYHASVIHSQPGKAFAMNTLEPRWDSVTAIWRDFFRRHGIAQVLGVAIEFEGCQTWAHLNLTRGPGAAAYTPGDEAALTHLAPSLR